MHIYRDTLNDALRDRSTNEHHGFSFVRADGANAKTPSETTLTFAEVVKEAQRRASAFAEKGLVPGDRIVIVVPDPQDFVLAFLGAVAGGFVPVPMFPPLAVRDLKTYEEGVHHVARTAGAKLRVTSASLDGTLAPHRDVSVPVALAEDLAAHPRFAEIARVDPEATAFLQFTSGSTARPKGVVVSHANLAANSRAFMEEGLRSSPDVDHGVTWLPLFHDMGLIGFVIGPLFADVAVTFLPTASFVRRPLVWLETIARKKGTITYAPNFAYELVAKRLKAGETQGLDLSSLRHAGCGAEPISATTLRAFAEKLAPSGFDPKVFLPSYGMAEATLAITFGGFQRGVRSEMTTDAITKREREIVACGRPFQGHEIAIWSDENVRLAEGEIGHIVARGPSICAGYFADAERSREAFGITGADGSTGWLKTGDLGYVRGGDLFVCGRAKDLVIVRGRNYYPSDIEWSVSEVDGVRKGGVVAFSTLSSSSTAAGEVLCIAAEAATSDPVTLRSDIARNVLERFALAIEEVILVTPGGLPRTSSGKLQRSKTREMHQRGTLPRLRSERTQAEAAGAAAVGDVGP